jgi:hypothetical protein
MVVTISTFAPDDDAYDFRSNLLPTIDTVVLTMTLHVVKTSIVLISSSKRDVPGRQGGTESFEQIFRPIIHQYFRIHWASGGRKSPLRVSLSCLLGRGVPPPT